MKRTLFLCLLLSLVASTAGCGLFTGGNSAQNELDVATQSYTVTATLLRDLRVNGVIKDQETWDLIKASDNAAYAALQTWQTALNNGADTAPAAAVFQAILQTLLDEYRKLYPDPTTRPAPAIAPQTKKAK